MMATAAVSPSEYLQQPATTAMQDTQPSPLALLAATCSKIGPPAVEAAVPPPPPLRPARKRLVPIQPAPHPLSPTKAGIGLLSPKGNIFQIQGSPLGAAGTAPGGGGGQLLFTIQNTGASGKAAHYQAPSQALPHGLGNQIQIISPHPKHVPIKPAPPHQHARGNLALPHALSGLAEPAAENAAQLFPVRPGKKLRKRLQPAGGAVPGSPTQEQLETVLIETMAENILQAGNNLLILQSPGAGNPALLQVLQPKADTQAVPIPAQALRVVQAASATLPTVPQKPAQSTDTVPTKICIRTAAGDLQAFVMQEIAFVPLPGSSGVPGAQEAHLLTPTMKNPARKERSLPKIAPAGGIISLNSSQLAAAAQAMQTISINGVQVQGVPVTITNTAGQPQLTVQNTPSSTVAISGLSPSQIQLQMEQALSGELQPGEKRRRMACTCPNCKEGEKRLGSQGKKKHVCYIPECGKTFRKTSLLRAHVRLHTGERPFACNWVFCSKRFTRSDELQRHARTHTGDKRFECPRCPKKFTRSDHLTKHFKTHLVAKKL